MFSLLLGLVIGTFATDVCLPATHEAHVHTHRWAESESRMSHHYDEYYEGDHLHVWVDAKSQMSLVHVYEWDYYAGQGEDHHVFSLRDYKKKYHWIGHWNHTTQTVTHCQLELFSRTWQPYCIARDATRRGSGTIGENNKVDFWEAVYDDGTFHEEIDILVEQGSPNLVVQERVEGSHFNTTEQKWWYWSEHREWFDFTTPDQIDPSVFAVPVGCPP